jgi:hypothetical protein
MTNTRHAIEPRGFQPREPAAQSKGERESLGIKPLSLALRCGFAGLGLNFMPLGTRLLCGRHAGKVLRPGFRWFHSIVWLTLLGFFVVCHGCHGDQDNELAATFVKQKSEMTTDCRAAATTQAPARVTPLPLGSE